ncbi:MAG: hypothetical protein ACD_77C00058G0005 [uncultured bacterium]|nr:MAG: hypothetical protein ACD_77C00058G0005 [uncultured bacterium]HBY02633.1 hypothetical protein [Rikenellaceae bacterium]
MKQNVLRIAAIMLLSFIWKANSAAGQTILKTTGEPISFLEFAVACENKTAEEVRGFFDRKGWNHIGSTWESKDKYGVESFTLRNSTGENDTLSIYIFDKKSIKGRFKTTDKNLFSGYQKSLPSAGFRTLSLVIEKDTMISKFASDDFEATFYEPEKSYRTPGNQSFLVIVERR